MWVQSLGWEDPLEKEMATHFWESCLENPMDKGAWQATVHGVTESGTTKRLSLSLSPFPPVLKQVWSELPGQHLEPQCKCHRETYNIQFRKTCNSSCCCC